MLELLFLVLLLNVLLLSNLATLPRLRYYFGLLDLCTELDLYYKYVFYIQCPVIEEFIFRWVLRDFGLYVTTILFGFAHLTNYYHIRHVPLVAYQSVICCFLGYICYSFENLWLAILAHAYFNILMTEISLRQNRAKYHQLIFSGITKINFFAYQNKTYKF